MRRLRRITLAYELAALPSLLTTLGSDPYLQAYYDGTALPPLLEQTALTLLSKDGKSIGAWSESLQRTVVVAAQDLQGRWVSLPYELLINGQPVQPEWEGA